MKVLQYCFLILIFIFLSCYGGATGNLRFKKLRYPASMTSFLYNNNGDLVSTRSGLTIISSIEYEKRFWSILYNFIHLDNSDDLDEQLNGLIRLKKGDGLVNLTIQNTSCYFNSIVGLNLLPFWPGCTILKINADVVKFR